MKTMFTPESWRRRLEAVKNAPPEILLYGVFSIVVCVADMWLTFLGPESLKAKTVPFTGWGTSMPYLFGLFWVFYLIFGSDRRYIMRLALVAPLLIFIFMGVVQYAFPIGETFDNPYLRISPWRPVWTIVLPAIWIALLLVAPRFRNPAGRLSSELSPVKA